MEEKKCELINGEGRGQMMVYWLVVAGIGVDQWKSDYDF